MTRQFFDYWAPRLRFLDVHYHARPDSYHRRYSAAEAGERYARHQGGVVLKNHLGSVSALAAAMQELRMLYEPLSEDFRLFYPQLQAFAQNHPTT